MSTARLIGLIAALVLSSCASTPRSEQRLDALVEAYFEDMLRMSPISATFIGDTRYNDRLAIDIAPRYRSEMAALHRRYLDRSRRLSDSELSPAARLTRAIFERECQMTLDALRWPTHLLPLDQTGGTPVTMAEFGGGESAQPFATAADYRAFLRRMSDFDTWSKQAILNMREGIEAGIVQPRTVMSKVLPQLEAMIVEDPQKSLFYRPVEKFPATIPAAERVELERLYRDAIARTIVPAYRQLATFIRHEYLPHARDSVAWTALPDGRPWYEYYVRYFTTTDMNADEIHAIGLNEVARIRGEMRKVQAQLGVAGELKDFFAWLAANPAMYFKNAEELLLAHRELKASIQAKLPDYFSRFPKAGFEVRPVEEFRAQAAAGAFYQPPSADGSRPGIFYVNTYNLKAQPRFGTTTLSLHEAAPGHHFQVALQQEIADLPRFRRFLVGYTAYVEGWALYAESLGREMNLFNDPSQYFGHLNDEMLRAMRLVVDTGLHTKQWTREQAIRYMLDNSYMAPSDAEAEVERYIANPGQALGYKIGQLKIRELRTRAEQALGPKFDLRRFHSLVLEDGPLPMDVLAAKVESWLGQSK